MKIEVPCELDGLGLHFTESTMEIQEDGLYFVLEGEFDVGVEKGDNFSMRFGVYPPPLLAPKEKGVGKWLSFLGRCYGQKKKQN